ncbi:MAG: threonine--tRNA ligase [Candidatus Korarchaeota archaeon]|nr:threonine--tRNA ligase [Candidatus Korarchaeota archaeon]NIU83805.1 threonine--tRNA ligase [Candidatus Thorarchaeota archaeon]NIW15219.1 threonine--tRNA ligase [Candidatus Thorarchaeota archaeon]NIW53196.1 threonine--tRNA ligase [Candidatus Korarchaeota archaeon]
MKVKLKGKQVIVEEGTTIAEFLERTGEQNIVAVEFEGDLRDLQEEIPHSGELKIVTLKSEKGRRVLNHSAAHLLAHAVKNLFPEAKPTIGSATRDLPGLKEIGFFYDFYRKEPFSSTELKKIEEKMAYLLEKGVSFKRVEVPKEEARKRCKRNKFKLELLEGMKQVTLYEQSTNHNQFTDLCKGPHLQDSQPIKAFKLLDTSSAYWKGDESNPTVYRIYGIAFPSEKELADYLERKEKVEKRDHLKLGKKLDLFRFYGEIAPGFPLYTPRGKILLKELKGWMREINEKLGYKEVRTPHLFKSKLWKQSGHYEAYKEKMFIIPKEGTEYAVKPMNCPGHIYLYKRKPRSYRDLPIRYSEFATVYRWERSGELHGLARVRSPIQDDGHVFCKRTQIKGEVKRILKVAEALFPTLGVEEFDISLSTKPEKHIGSDKTWEIATTSLRNALEELNKEYKVEEGEGAFYGPKIDIHIKDALGRLWQCTTIQLDFFMASRFDLRYTKEDGENATPLIIHRAIFGSLDRLLAILLEHWNGKFPLWLSPVQARVIPIADRNHSYADQIVKKLKDSDVRAKGDYRRETLGYKIRDAQVQRVPYMIIVGDREEENNTISVRKRTEEEEQGIKLGNFIDRIKELIESRSLKL